MVLICMPTISLGSCLPSNIAGQFILPVLRTMRCLPEQSTHMEVRHRYPRVCTQPHPNTDLPAISGFASPSSASSHGSRSYGVFQTHLPRMPTLTRLDFPFQGLCTTNPGILEVWHTRSVSGGGRCRSQVWTVLPGCR